MAEGTKDQVFERWWPLPTSLDLVRAPIDRVAAVLEAEWERTYRQPVRKEWVEYEDIDAVFRSVATMTNSPSMFLAR